MNLLLRELLSSLKLEPVRPSYTSGGYFVSLLAETISSTRPGRPKLTHSSLIVYAFNVYGERRHA